MFRESSTYDTVRPYLNRAIEDEEVRSNVMRAFKAARKVYDELSGESGVKALNKLTTNKGDLRDDLDTTVQSLSEALLRMSGNRPRKRSAWGPVLLLALGALVLFNPATGASTRAWLKDHLFGSEEEFDYSSPSY